MAGWKSAKPWWGLAICLILLTLWAARPLGVNAPRSVETAFDTERALGRLKMVLGDERPHPTDSAANDAVRDRLLAQIRQEGFAPDVHTSFHCNAFREGAAICARPQNIVFWVTPPGDDAVMLASHYDSVPAGPGAADDGIGVATTLEVAHLLKGKSFKRPILVLITDAEEAGLIGAAAFAANDPLAKRVGAIVNMEARGTTGGVNMFQTSRPNSDDIAALAAGGQVPAANALATDFYELLPNDTDLTMWLPLGVDAGNYSIIGGGKRYHTPLDNLAHLDPRSVRQMGASALAAVTGFANTQPTRDEGQSIFTDIGRSFLLVLPSGAAVAVLALGLVAAFALYWRSGRTRRVRAGLVPPLALFAGTGLAVAAALLIAALRSDAAFGTAYPIALRVMYGAAALTGASLVIHLMRAEGRVRLAAATWLWLGAPILAAFAVIPGLSILVVWPLMLVIAAAIASFAAPLQRFVPALMLTAAILFALIVLPLAGGLEEGLFIEQAAPVASLMVLLLLVFMPVGERSSRLVPATCAVLFIAAFVAALVVPPYTTDDPRHLTIIHEDAEGKAAFLIEDNGPLPAGIKAAAAFADRPDDKGYWRAPAPRLADDGSLVIRSDTTSGTTRTITLAATSPSADRQELLIKKGDAIEKITVNGAQPKVTGVPAYIGCTGRSCRELMVELVLKAKTPLPDIIWRRTRYGLGEAGARLAAQRPATAQPVHVGDRQSLSLPVPLAKLAP